MSSTDPLGIQKSENLLQYATSPSGKPKGSFHSAEHDYQVSQTESLALLPPSSNAALDSQALRAQNIQHVVDAPGRVASLRGRVGPTTDWKEGAKDGAKLGTVLGLGTSSGLTGAGSIGIGIAVAAGAFKGAVIGGAIGSVIPFLGTGVGAVVGAAIGGILVGTGLGAAIGAFIGGLRAKMAPKPLSDQQQAVRDELGVKFEQFLKRIGTDTDGKQFAKTHGLTKEELVSLFAYTIEDADHSFLTMNPVLRKRSPSQLRNEPILPLIQQANKGLKKLPDHRGEVLRYTNHMDADLLARYQPEATIYELGFTSTSKGSEKRLSDLEQSASAKVIWKIQSKHGKHIKDLSANPKEDEVLFAPGTAFRVTRRENQDGKVVIHMTEVDRNGSQQEVSS